MKNLIESIKNSTVDNTQEVESSILSMICPQGSPIPLSSETLVNAIDLDGEFLVLKLHYSDFENELKSEKIKYKMSQALSVVVSYEDDGSNFLEIEKFVKYIHANADIKQNAIFGVKSVSELSEFPITILFSAILPINQLKMTVGSKIDTLIHSDDEYFKPRFAKHREEISQEIGIPLLPVLPILDRALGEYQLRLIDLFDGRVISEFEVNEKLSEDVINKSLLKLFYIYKVLADEKAQKALH